MLNRLVKFQGHIRTEKYALNYTTEAELRKRYERYINPSFVVSVDTHIDSAFDAQQIMFVSAKHYCKVWTVHGAFEVDGTLDSVVDALMKDKGVDCDVRHQPR